MTPEQRTVVILMVVVTLTVALTFFYDRRRPPGRFTRWTIRATEMLAHEHQQWAAAERARGHLTKAARDERRARRYAGRAASIREDYKRHGHHIDGPDDPGHPESEDTS